MENRLEEIVGEEEELLAKATANCRKLIEHLLGFTLGLVRFESKEAKEPVGIASGFIVKNEGRHYVLTAAHAATKPGWLIETNVILEKLGKTLCLAPGPFNLIQRLSIHGQIEEIDFAWAELNLTVMREALQQDGRLDAAPVELSAYEGPLDTEPAAGEAYTYAAWNKTRLVRLGTLLLEREASYETCMEFNGPKGLDEYVFKLAGQHKGHSNYYGASGAPIVCPEGKIVSMVLGGCEERGEIYGLKLKRFIPLLPFAAVQAPEPG